MNSFKHYLIRQDKPVLLFSTGMDSYIIKRLDNINTRQCIFIDMGTAENVIEKERILKYFPDTTIVEMPLAPFALPNNIIPFRNHILAMIAMQFSSEVIFGFTAGDTTRDKDYVFKAQMEGIANYFSGVPEKVRAPGPYVVKMPYKDCTKSDLVSKYFAAGFDPMDLLLKSVSCYEGSHAIYGCGRCRSCLRKLVAIYSVSPSWANTLNGGMEYNAWDYLEAFYEESTQKKRDVRELKEIELCLKKM